MMQRPSDEMLVAFLDGEVDEARFAEIAAWLDRDPSLRARLGSLTEATALVREAFEPILREPVPERLFAATHPGPATVVEFRAKAAGRAWSRTTRWWVGAAAAASFACFIFGATIGPIVPVGLGSTKAAGPNLDNFPVLYIQMVKATASEVSVDIPPPDTGTPLPSDVILPDLKPWGLVFYGGRRIAAEGKPAFQFFYTTDNKELGPVTLFVTNTSEPDVEPTFDKRENVNMLYWRHRGHGYYIVGGANKGWMWSLKNDIAYQLKAL
jgi:anti-sigma factor RsiW